MVEETPEKVLTLLGIALFSLAFLVGVSYTNSSFTKTEVAMPNPFGPTQVMASLNDVATGYKIFLASSPLQPPHVDLSTYKLGYIALLRLNQADASQYASAPAYQGRVAGAYTYAPAHTPVAPAPVAEDNSGFSIDTIYNLLIK